MLNKAPFNVFFAKLHNLIVLTFIFGEVFPVLSGQIIEIRSTVSASQYIIWSYWDSFFVYNMYMSIV